MTCDGWRGGRGGDGGLTSGTWDAAATRDDEQRGDKETVFSSRVVEYLKDISLVDTPRLGNTADDVL